MDGAMITKTKPAMSFCQMTVSLGTFGEGSHWESYGECGKPAKFKLSNPVMGVEYVCGIHARSLNKTYERIGKPDRCIPLEK